MKERMMINGPPFWRGTEAARTERAAIEGWGPTLRLLVLRTGVTVCWTGAAVVVTHVANVVHMLP